MSVPCGCCAGTEVLTPLTTANRPGLPALSYRVGTHATFLETMKARLSSFYLEIPEDALDAFGRQKLSRIYPLRDLKTRSPDDPAIAWLDAWATVGAVLTFYQERLANEGYLRTATERRSILELARLIGYVLRPGVASTVYLAYSLDEDRSVTPPKPTAVTIPAGARAQSVPGPGELPQSFETADSLDARSPWNNLQARLTQPQTEDSIENREDLDPDMLGPRIYLKGIGTNLKLNDPLLVQFGTDDPVLFRVLDVQPDAAADRTLVRLEEWTAQPATAALAQAVGESLGRYRLAVQTLNVGNLKIVKSIAPALHALEAHLTTAQPVETLMTSVQTLTTIVSSQLPAARKHARHAQLVPLLDGLALELGGATQLLATSKSGAAPGASATSKAVIDRNELLGPLLKPASVPPASSAVLGRDPREAFVAKADTGLQLLGALQPRLSDALPVALANAKTTPSSTIKAFAFRVKSAPFGNGAPKRTRFDRKSDEVAVIGEWPIQEWTVVPNPDGATITDALPHEEPGVLYLEASYDGIMAGSVSNPSWIVIDAGAWTMPTAGSFRVSPENLPKLVTTAVDVKAGVSRADYGISGKTTRIKLGDPWLRIDTTEPDTSVQLQDLYDNDFRVLRALTIYAQSEELLLAEEPITDDVCGGKKDPIELDGLYDGLKSGRWLIVSGERTDIENDAGVTVPGVKASELVMIAKVTQDVKSVNAGVGSDTGEDVMEVLPGDRIHSFVYLAEDLAYCYKRDTVTVYGNVAKATHGETRSEVLGGGDGSKSLQQFPLRQPPLTFVPAPNPAGVDSTLQVRVNDVLWHETDSLAALLPTDRNFITRTDDDGKTRVIFGTGTHGARLPTGQENVKAVYRNGIGKPGNAKADQISLLATRPLGVKAVTNPIRASGGADKESRDQARQNAPLAVMALDRLVSTQDYADFARTFAGIGKASATRLSDGHRQLVHVTIAGADDIPIEPSSDLYRNLLKALRAFGDPYLPVRVDVRELLALVISANVQVLPDYQLETVEPLIRATLLDTFGFQRRDLGQNVYLSEVVATIQRVTGVAYVDVDVLSSISETELSTPALLAEKLQALTASSKPESCVPVYLAETAAQAQQHRPTSPGTTIYPAQLAFLIPDVPATLILNEVQA